MNNLIKDYRTEKMLALRQDGDTYNEIGIKFGISGGRVRQILQAYYYRKMMILDFEVFELPARIAWLLVGFQLFDRSEVRDFLRDKKTLTWICGIGDKSEKIVLEWLDESQA